MKTYFGNLATAALALTLGAGSVSAQTFPSRQIRVVEGFNTGAGDATIRLVTAEMSRLLGQPVIVDPVVGAGGVIAANTVAKAPPDGYTLTFLGLAGMSDIFYKSNYVEAEKSFEAITNLCYSPWLLSASAKLPVKTFQELVAYSKKNPGKLNLGTTSAGPMMLAEMLKERMGITFTQVPYPAPAALMTATVGGTVDLALTSVAGWAPQVRNGTANVLFVTPARRLVPLPDAPTAAELGFGDFLPGQQIGLWAPRGTQQAAIQRLNTAAVAAVKNPEIVQKLRGEAILVEPDGSTPAELIEVYRKEYKFFSEAARLAKFVPQ